MARCRKKDCRSISKISRRVRRTHFAERNRDRADTERRETLTRAGDQRGNHRTDAARERRKLRHSQSRWLRNLSGVQIQGSARGSRRYLRSVDDARARDARERGDFEAGAPANSVRADRESESESAGVSSAGWRSLRANRSAKG